jgi:hypothetical protein
MRLLLLVAGIAFTQDFRFPDVAGTWEVRASIGLRDSVVAAYEMNSAPSVTGWLVKLPGRDPLPARVIAAGGDSVVFEIGPFPSILRAGETVTTRTTAHYRGDSLTGRIVARFSRGDSLLESVSGRRLRRSG